MRRTVNALVLGNGSSGRWAAELLRREGHAVAVLDGNDAWPGGDWDLCVTSPGVPLSHPWQVAARAARVKVISELQLGASRWKGRMLAVTGSKGKSSVVKLVADALNLAGIPAIPCGNFGKPLCEVVLSCEPEAWAIVEVSSFQMETTDDFHPEAAAILNLQEDHLDRHGSVEVYHGLKRKLLAGAKITVVADAAWDECLAGSYFDNDILRSNGEIAAGLLSAAGLDRDRIAAGFKAFEPLPHRMQRIAEISGVRYVDDSKATSLAALAAGVEMCGGPVRLIAGGLAKGDDPASVIPRLRSFVRKAYLIGRCAEHFFEAWRNAFPCELCGTLERAAVAASSEAAAGETVLLSPGAASFDQFPGYGARGDAFAGFVRRMHQSRRVTGVLPLDGSL